MASAHARTILLLVHARKPLTPPLPAAQNIILAFAGRVLLRKADVRFERGHRYGLIGQNGTGKTTLLNRLAAKDINGFPQELRTWYIRHEVRYVCVHRRIYRRDFRDLVL